VFSPAAGSPAVPWPPSGAAVDLDHDEQKTETPNTSGKLEGAGNASGVAGNAGGGGGVLGMEAELRALRRQVAAEGDLSETQLESLLEYLRQGPRSPTRADEEKTMAHIASVLPLEKMTVVTTVFKIIYKEEAIAAHQQRGGLV
jgi:hypothetical protein